MVKLEFQIDLSYVVNDPTCDFIFNIHAAQTECQTVLRENLQINQPVVTILQTHSESKNRLLRLQAAQGPLTLSYSATVTIDHRLRPPAEIMQVPIAQLPTSVLQYLNPSRYCQSDRLQKFALTEFGHLAPGYSRAIAICDWVRSRIAFQVQTSNVNTSAIDTLIERVGVCRDFAHLMITLCRALSMPARIASGIDYGADAALGVPDFHAYVEVYLSDGWYIFDPSGLAVPMGFLRFGTGQDAADVAFATIFGAVQASMPQVTINAIEDAAQQIVAPYHTNDALSTDAGSFDL